VPSPPNGGGGEKGSKRILQLRRGSFITPQIGGTKKHPIRIGEDERVEVRIFGLAGSATRDAFQKNRGIIGGRKESRADHRESGKARKEQKDPWVSISA